VSCALRAFVVAFFSPSKALPPLCLTIAWPSYRAGIFHS
jgi:hypothetical protein